MEQSLSSFYLEAMEQLSEIPDPRRKQGRRYALVPLLMLLITGFLRGGKNVKDILERSRHDASWLAFLRLKRPPAPGTYTHLFGQLSLDEVNAALRRTGLSMDWRGEQVMVDGKTVKGSLRDGLYLHVVNAASETGAALALTPSAPAGGEIEAAARVLSGLPLEGVVVTGDAMFAQRELSGTVKKKAATGSGN